MQPAGYQEEGAADETRKRSNKTKGVVPRKVRRLAAEEGQVAQRLEEDDQAKQGDDQAKQGDDQAKQVDGRVNKRNGKAKKEKDQTQVRHLSERQKKLKKRLSDVRFRTRKLKKRVDGLVTEIEGLQEIKSRMDCAIRTTCHFMDILRQCLNKREARITQSRDTVKAELLNEVESMKNGQDLLQKTLILTNDQLRKNYDLKYRLQRDLGNLFQVSFMATDEYYANPGSDESEQNRPSEDSEVDYTYESSEEWLASGRNIRMAKREIRTTEILYFHMDNMLWHINCTQSKQVNTTNMAFNVSIAESKIRLEKLLNQIMNKLKSYNVYVKDPTMALDLLALSTEINNKLKGLCNNEAEIVALHNKVVIQKF